MFILKQPSEGFSKKRCYEKFRRIYMKTSEQESLFWCFLVNFAKFLRTHFLQNSTERLLLIIVVSIIGKGVLANETVNYDTKTEVLYINLSQKCQLLKRRSPGERTGFRSSRSQTSN